MENNIQFVTKFKQILEKLLENNKIYICKILIPSNMYIYELFKKTWDEGLPIVNT